MIFMWASQAFSVIPVPSWEPLIRIMDVTDTPADGVLLNLSVTYSGPNQKLALAF